MDEDRLIQLEIFYENDPNDPFLKYALALEYQTRNKEKAIELFNNLLLNHPDYLATYYQAAHFYAELNLRDRADHVFKKGIEIAQKQNEVKILGELSNAYQNFLIEEE